MSESGQKKSLSEVLLDCVGYKESIENHTVQKSYKEVFKVFEDFEKVSMVAIEALVKKVEELSSQHEVMAKEIQDLKSKLEDKESLKNVVIEALENAVKNPEDGGNVNPWFKDKIRETVKDAVEATIAADKGDNGEP